MNVVHCYFDPLVLPADCLYNSLKARLNESTIAITNKISVRTFSFLFLFFFLYILSIFLFFSFLIRPMLLVSILDWPFSDSLSFINKFKYVKFELFDLYNNVYIEAWMDNALDDRGVWLYTDNIEFAIVDMVSHCQQFVSWPSYNKINNCVWWERKYIPSTIIIKYRETYSSSEQVC